MKLATAVAALAALVASACVHILPAVAEQNPYTQASEQGSNFIARFPNAHQTWDNIAKFEINPAFRTLFSNSYGTSCAAIANPYPYQWCVDATTRQVYLNTQPAGGGAFAWRSAFSLNPDGTLNQASIANGSVTGSMLAPGAAANNLGFNPVQSVAGRAGNVTLSSSDLSDATTAGRTLFNAASAAAQKSALAIASADVTDSTSAGRGLLTAADATAQKALLGIAPWSTPSTTITSDIPAFGGTDGKSIADSGYSIGTIGHAIPALDGANTWSAAQTFLNIESNINNSRTAAYTITSSDCGKSVTLSGGFYTVTLPAVTGFNANCSIIVKNNDTRAKSLSGFPSDQRTMLWPGQSLGVRIVSGSWLAFNKPHRWALQSATTFYVNSNPGNGSDSNDGLATGTGAFQTLQKAWDTIVSDIDTNFAAVTIKAEDGTYTTGLRAGPQPPTGGGQINLLGNTTTPTNVLIAPTAANSIGVQAIGPVFVSVAGIYCNSSNLISCLYTDIGGNIQINGNMNFGTVAGNHIQTSHGFIFPNASYTISGSAQYHINSSYSGAQVEYGAGTTVTLTGTPAFTFFAFAFGGGSISANHTSVTFTGAATGTRYVASVNGVIDSIGGGSTYFPGSVAGSTSNGGQYN